MRHKTITLCPTSYEIAKKMPNFSQWIRKKLLSLDSEHDVEYLSEQNERMSALLKDIIGGQKVWVEGHGWMKNQYERDEE